MDRMNVGFAKLQMMDTLGFSDTAFGIGAGIMFVGYCLLEVPSNLLMARIGARKTFVRIMVLWGLTAAATAFVRTPVQFYVVRFFLGVFEAGFFPASCSISVTGSRRPARRRDYPVLVGSGGDRRHLRPSAAPP